MPEQIFLEQKSVNLEIPAIYKLIEGGATPQAIAHQLYVDFYSPERDPEKVFLAINGLQRRGVEGLAMITQLASGTDELGELLREVRQKEATGESLMTILGLNYLNSNTTENCLSESDLFKKSYQHAKIKGYTNLSLIECLNRDVGGHGYLPKHLSGKIEDEVVAVSSTFGNEEIEYARLLGPIEILRLRSMGSPNFLLLGSYGVYSAREFRSYVKKINSRNKSFVVDIDDFSIRKLSEDVGNKGKLVQGDARNLAFADETMDSIYTNYLFKFLNPEYSRIGNKDDNLEGNIKKLLQEAFRVLKSGGELVMVENIPDENITYEEFKKSFILWAQKTGFVVEKIDSECLSFAVRKEAGTITIDSNGFPHVGDSLLLKDKINYMFGFLLRKP